MTYSSETAAAIAHSETVEAGGGVCRFCGSAKGQADSFCGSCGRVQPVVSDVSYFDVFKLPRKLKLDFLELEREFYRLSRRLHPDAFARAGQEEQEWSLANSSLLNDAYRTLKDPIKRTEYLLRLEGILSADEGGAKKEDRIPADMLEEVFELNMQLDEMRMNRKMGEDDPQLGKDLSAAKAKFDEQMRAANAKLEALWGRWDASVDAADEGAKQSVKDELAALLDRRRYIRNLVNSVDEALGS